MTVGYRAMNLSASLPGMNPVLLQQQIYPLARLDALKDELRAKGQPLFDFGVGAPAEETPAFIREALIRGVSARSQYPTVAGKPQLRRTIADYLRRRFDVALDPDTEILASSGSKEAVFQLPLALIDPASEKRVVIYADPCYPVYERGTQFAGGICHPVALKAERRFLLEPDDLPDELLRRTALFWISYPHNPTGAVADLAYLRRLVEAAEKYDFVIASDECYADLYFGEPPPSALQVSKRRVLSFHSCSKRSGMTGYRSGFIAGDATLIAALAKMRSSIGVASPDFIQAAAIAAWSDDTHVEQRREIFRAKREKMLAFFAEKGLEAPWSEATFFLWVKVPRGYTSESYAERLLKEGIVVSPGSFFGAGEGFFRVALVPTLEEMDEAIARWRTVD